MKVSLPAALERELISVGITENLCRWIEDWVNREVTAAYNQGKEAGGAGKITWDEARHLASTYDGGEGRHPLARHRDSMG